MVLQEMKWATFRLLFYSYLGFCLVTGIGGFLTLPVFTILCLGDWRFWRHIGLGYRVYLHGWKMFSKILTGENEGYMFSVPLRSPPHSVPDRQLAKLSPTWELGNSCGPCNQCCSKFNCPILTEDGLCKGYESFFWRYFNCGRFPSNQREIEYYACEKWLVKPHKGGSYAEDPAGDYLGEEPVTAID